MRRRTGFGFKLAVAFAAVAALTAALAAVFLTVTWQRQFTSYVREGLQARADDAATVMGSFYAETGGWDALRFVDLSHVGLVMSGMHIRLLDRQDKLIAETIGLPGGHVAVQTRPTDEELAEMEQGLVAVAPVVVDGVKVGEVRVGSISPGGLLTARDLQFRQASLVGLLIAAVLAVASATVAGVLFARTLTRPVNRVTEVAARLRSGERDARTGMVGTDAVSQLGLTVDEMADAIEADREFERRLTADVAHELRTPLQAIQATVEAMQDGVLPADPERLGVVREETVRLARLTNSILELARLERGNVAFEMRPIDPAAPVRTAVEAHRALIESCDLELVVQVQDGLTIDGDIDRLTQAVGNLLANAARYTPPSGRITVSLTSRADEAVISVADTGIGIAEEDLPRVFARFWRADPARERAKGGVGIGLAVVKEIVERHDGHVAVHSVEGAGSTFTIALPLASGVIPPRWPVERRGVQRRPAGSRASLF